MALGEQEDSRAFLEAYHAALRPEPGWQKKYAVWPIEQIVVRHVWDAAIRRGIELRGCCQDSCASCRAVHHLHTEEP